MSKDASSMPAIGRVDCSGKDLEQYTSGLPISVATLPNTSAFGESGDVFNHSYWSRVFIAFSSCPHVVKELLKLANQVLLRGRADKDLSKSKASAYTINIGTMSEDQRELINMKDQVQFRIIIAHPLETTRVTEWTLTSERVKCCLRYAIVPALLLSGKYPATSSAIGYSVFANEYIKFDKLMGNHEHYTAEELQAFMPDLPIDTIKDFLTLRRVAKSNGVGSWFSGTSFVSGSITQKEIYPKCEEMYPGTVCLAGIHAIMTDISCKRRAETVTADRRQRYENSSFYADFKRKMNLRNMPQVKHPAYITILQNCIPLMGYFIKTGAHMTAQEASIIDMVMRDVQERERRATAAEMTAGISTSDPEDAEAAMLKRAVDEMAKSKISELGRKGKGGRKSSEE